MSNDLPGVISAVSAALVAQKDRLNDLDAIMGDGEHGSNIAKCATAVEDALPGFAGKDTPAVLNGVGMKLLSAGGGTASTLMGFALMKASQLAKGKDLSSTADAAGVLRGMLDSVAEKSKAQPGDKTLMDALRPAVEAFEAAAGNGDGMNACWQAAAKAAAEGAEATKEMLAQRGRGLYVGERGIGTEDPGAVSISIIFATVAAQTA